MLWTENRGWHVHGLRNGWGTGIEHEDQHQKVCLFRWQLLGTLCKCAIQQLGAQVCAAKYHIQAPATRSWHHSCIEDSPQAKANREATLFGFEWMKSWIITCLAQYKMLKAASESVKQERVANCFPHTGLPACAEAVKEPADDGAADDWRNPQAQWNVNQFLRCHQCTVTAWPQPKFKQMLSCTSTMSNKSELISFSSHYAAPAISIYFAYLPSGSKRD